MYRSTDPDLFERSPEQLVRAGEFDAALELIAALWPSVSTTEGSRLRSLIGEIPEHEWADDPRMLAAMGASYRSVGSASRSAALPWFRAAEGRARAVDLDGVELATILTHHSAALRSLGQIDASRLSARAAIAVLDSAAAAAPSRIRAHAHAALQLGLAEVHSGEWPSAVEHLRLALGLADAVLVVSEIVECLAGLSVAAVFSGDLDTAADYADRARDLASGSTILESQFGVGALIALTLIAAQRGELATANTLAPVALDAAIATDWHPLALFAAGRLAVVGGGHLEGLAYIRRSLEALSSWSGETFLDAHARVIRAELLTTLGEYAAATATLDDVVASANHDVCPARVHAGIRYKAGDDEGCLVALHSCLELGDSHASSTVIDVHVLAAAAHLDLGDVDASDLAFDRALLAAAGTTIRTGFLLISAPTLARLVARAADRTLPRCVDTVLRSLTADAGTLTSGVLEPLSDRERDIAGWLLHDKTIGQIAGELFISTNTVKTHVRSIYRKLSASNRKEAVRRVRELGLESGHPRGDEPAKITLD